MPGSRLRQIGWILSLVICVTLFGALTFHVNAVKSEVRLAERKIIALKRQNEMLEIEFQTRANQQQLANWNEVEFGYQAPTAEQFLENERQLASLGAPRAADAPEPIRVASAPRPEEDGNGFPAFVSPLSGQPANAAEPQPSGQREKLMAAARKEMGEFSSRNRATLSGSYAKSSPGGSIRVAIGSAQASGGGE